MEKIKINWISEILEYKVESALDAIINQVLDVFRPFLNFSKLDIILIPFAKDPRFQKTLETL